MQPQQRIALVTAATGGIGLGIAKSLLDAGHRVVISGRDPLKGQRVATELEPAGGATFVAADALDRVAVEAMVDHVADLHGRIDVLVNNAGGSSGFAQVHELSDEAWMQAFHWNVSSTFWATRRALPHMMRAGFGRIVNIGSVQGKQVNRAKASHYVMAKHAVNGFTKAVAFEYGRAGITCNAICVGAVETDLMRTAGARSAEAEGVSYEFYRQRYANLALTGRLNTPEEVGAMVALLASDAGGGITGSVMNVDGGICAY